MPINSLLNLITYNKKMLWLILLCNILGTLYGYIWYGGQLSVTDWQYKIFVPDSPTASLFLCIVLIAYLFDKNLPIIEALAFVTLIKYGVWAVIMNIIMFIEYNNITIVGCMLIMSHGIMAVEAFLFYRRFKITITGFIVAMIWAFHNDIIDYVFMQYPYYDFIDSHLASVAYLAFWLSVISLLLYLVRLKQCKTFDHS